MKPGQHNIILKIYLHLFQNPFVFSNKKESEYPQSISVSNDFHFSLRLFVSFQSVFRSINPPLSHRRNSICYFLNLSPFPQKTRAKQRQINNSPHKNVGRPQQSAFMNITYPTDKLGGSAIITLNLVKEHDLSTDKIWRRGFYNHTARKMIFKSCKTERYFGDGR